MHTLGRAGWLDRRSYTRRITLTGQDTADRLPESASGRSHLRWWREVVYILAVYFVYSTVRNMFGSAGGPSGHSNGIAYGHAKVVVEIEKAIRLYFEQGLQEWYLQLPAHGVIEFWNIFYGSAHFIVTTFALIWLFRRGKDRYPLWRNTLALTTILALIGFATFELMPPRLLDEPQAEYGPPVTAVDRDWGYVDTLADYGTLWSFDSEALKDISNQYAAMPSLHVGWALWCVGVMLSMVRRRWLRWLIIAHPIATLFCIVVTANHYWIDGLGGAAVFGAGYLIAIKVTPWLDQRRVLASRGNRRG